MKAVGISLSGVMAPGAVTAATIAAGTRRRHAGMLIAVGHGIVEFPLMFMIMAGMDRLFASEAAKIVVGLAGGVMMLWMGAGMWRERNGTGGNQAKKNSRGPVWTGVVLSAGNPYFLLWWATVGLTLATQARDFGAWAFALFAVIHWTCDLIWLEILSWTSFKGSHWLGGRWERIVLTICAVALAVFGVMFIYNAARGLLH
jgi:threonine/homoserine/homoserine lactone efflux protein